MSLTEISAVASIASSFAVAVSLVYLALQTHQNAKHTKALVWNATQSRIVNMHLAMADENLCRAAIIENGAEATREAVVQRQCRFMSAARLSNLIDIIRQMDMGVIDDASVSFRSTSVGMLRNEPAFLRHVKSVLPHQGKSQDATPAQRRIRDYLRSMVEEAERPVSLQSSTH